MRPESELAASSQQILASRPDLKTVVLPMLVQRFPQLTEAEIMVIAGTPWKKSATTAQFQALPLEQLESLADALLDFQCPADLSAWLAANS